MTVITKRHGFNLIPCLSTKKFNCCFVVFVCPHLSKKLHNVAAVDINSRFLCHSQWLKLDKHLPNHHVIDKRSFIALGDANDVVLLD